MSSWLDRIQHIIDSEPVDAGAAGRPDRQLEQNLRHLKELIELSLLGQALVASDVTVSPDVQIGQPVFWNADTARAELAMAKIHFDPVLGTMVSDPEAEVLGTVWRKSGATLADIVIIGWIELDISNAVTGETLAGQYFLSGAEPGKLVRGRPSLSVPVLFSDGRGKVLIRPSVRNWTEDHGHFKFDLTCAPAGDHAPPSPGDPHVITDADDSLPGWLPADDASFNEHAPAGAKFGYNLAAHPGLSGLWPPFPTSAASLTLDRGENYVGGTEVPTGDNLGVAVIDQYGIWWMTDCYGDVPWPTDFTFENGSEAVDEGQISDCPRPEIMRLSLHFSKTQFDAADTMVTSLIAAPDSILRVTGCSGETARTGDLMIDAVLSLLISNQTDAGHMVLKNIGTDNKFTRGPVVEGITVSGSGLTAESTATEGSGGSAIHRGRVLLTISLSPADKELQPGIVRLSDTKERFENGIPYVGFPVGYASSVRLRFDVPPDGVAEDTNLTCRLVWLGTTAGTPPTMAASYRVIPAATETPAELPTTDTDFDMPAPPVLADGGQYYLLALPAVVVNPGDTLLLELSRPIDAYAGEMGLLRCTAVLG